MVVLCRWMEVGKGITNTCHESYDRADTKLGPEAFRFSEAIEARALKQNERSDDVLFFFLQETAMHSQKYSGGCLSV